MVSWLLQAFVAAASCRVVPILADEDFYVPASSDAFAQLCQHPVLQKNPHATDYVTVLKSIFTQIAVHFWSKSYSESTLSLKARC